MTTYERVKEWRKKNPEKVAEQNRRYNRRHPETHKKAAKKYREKNLELIRERDRLIQKKRRKNNPEGQKKRNEHYKIRREAKRWELAGRPRALICELCSAEELTVFDHCHLCDMFRGWICDRCNKMLGLCKDSSDLLRKMANYLEKHGGETNCKEEKCAS